MTELEKYQKYRDETHLQKIHFKEMKVDIEDCARCCKDHLGLEVRAFKNPIKEGGRYATFYRYWASCPNTDEPIVFNLKAENMEEGWTEKVVIWCCYCRNPESEVSRWPKCECKCHPKEEEDDE